MEVTMKPKAIKRYEIPMRRNSSYKYDLVIREFVESGAEAIQVLAEPCDDQRTLKNLCANLRTAIKRGNYENIVSSYDVDAKQVYVYIKEEE